MPERPSIPAEITRTILIESGHRCAVCGAGCPLERAHIIPWHKSREHKADDLICLCASCHERADQEHWGEKALREYKQRPWVCRQYKNTESIPEPTCKVELTIEMELSQFDEHNQRLLQYAIAGFLNVSPFSVRITSIEESNSVKVGLELPAQSAEKLLRSYEENDQELARYLAPFVIVDLHRQAEVLKWLKNNKRTIMVYCRTCDGSGSVKCPRCSGTGRVAGGLFGSPSECKHCHGSGVKRCGVCVGRGYA